MSKGYGLDDIKMQKFYIVSSPTKLSQLHLDDIDGDDDIVAKGRKLRARRMARIRNQLD
jgi:hypothetical protein